MMIKFLLYIIIFAGWAVNGCLASELAVQTKIAHAIKQYLIEHRPDWRDGRIEVRLERAGDLLRKIDQKHPQAEFKIDHNYAARRVSSQSILPILIIEKGIEQGRVNISARSQVFKKAVKASQKIPKGTRIEASSIELAETDISQAASKYFTDPRGPAGKIANHLILPGCLVLDWMVKDHPDMARGMAVKILVRSAGIKLFADGLAMEDGKIGDKIKVKRESAKSYLLATVLSSREVEIAI